MLKIAKKSHFLQELVINIISSIHPSIEHNIDKVKMLKRAFFHCELEEIEGGYFEFGTYEGTSLYSAVQNHRKIKSKITRKFYGYDSFDDGFKYFNEKDKHPFFKEGDFVSSYERAKKRFKKFENVELIKGYFEETVGGKDVREMYRNEKCAIIFLDCDLMGPALVSLEFIKPILQRGSVIILDDYWAYRADTKRGTCGALNTFLEDNPNIKLRDYYNYGHGGKSFVVCEI